MRLTLHPNAAYTGHGSYQHHRATEEGPKPGQREPTSEGTMPWVLGDRPRPQRGRDIRAKTSEGDRRGIERSRRGSRGIEGPRRGSREIEGTSILLEGSRRSSGILEGPRRGARGPRDVRTGSDVVGGGCRGCTGKGRCQ